MTLSDAAASADAAPLRFADPDEPALPLHLATQSTLPELAASLPDAARRWIEATGYDAAAGRSIALPDGAGGVAGAIFGLAPDQTRPFAAAAAADALPAGAWRIATPLAQEAAEEVGLGWLLHGYRFGRYRKDAAPRARLAAPEGVDARRLETIAAGVALARDLVNTPANDLGPDGLEQAARALAEGFGASLDVVSGEALETGFPMIAAVGRAAAEPPRLLDLRWEGAADGPRVTLVGKGVCFDTGGLDLKPAAGMRLMKKDMGGAACVLGVARMVMTAGLPLRLRVLIPAVENAVSAAAFRPGDVLRSRKGLTVEIGNTDAEGRLVLGDALTYACEEGPDLLVDFATLTGAARVALGPDLPALFTDDDALALGLAESGARVRDPLWRLPLWSGYDAMLKSPVADIDNAPAGGMAGAVTAALFLRRFVAEGTRWAHFDVFCWTPKAAPGRPMGGELQAGRALFDMLARRHG